MKQLSLPLAVAIGLASMLGAGVFGVWPALAESAGSWILVSIAIAGLVATLNALSVYQLARQVSRPGGIYSYARVYLSKPASYLAGRAFVLGKAGSVAAISLVFAHYLAAVVWWLPTTLSSVAAIALIAAINILGINRTATLAAILAGITLFFLVFSFGLGMTVIPDAQSALPAPALATDVLQGAAIMFFAFAGYARVATLGDEVQNPKENIPRAIVISLVAVIALYLALGWMFKRSLGAGIVQTWAPFIDLYETVFGSSPNSLIFSISALAALGSMLALLAGVARTAATMAEDGESFAWMARRNRHGSPYRAEIAIACLAALLVQLGDLTIVIAVSSFSVLLYYSIGHLAALRQPESERKFGRWVSWFGLLLAALLAVTLPWPVVLGSVVYLALGLAWRRLRLARANRRKLN